MKMENTLTLSLSFFFFIDIQRRSEGVKEQRKRTRPANSGENLLTVSLLLPLE